MSFKRNNLISHSIRYIAIVVLPLAVIVATSIMWNRSNKPGEVVEVAIQTISQDSNEVITILEGSRIIREAITPTLKPPTVSTTVPATAKPAPTNRPVYMARLSHYNPRLLGPNCHVANITADGKCNALLHDGRQWQHWTYYEGWGMACPKVFKLGTQFIIPGFQSSSHDGFWTCVDRGGAINVIADQYNSFFLDLLRPEPIYISPRLNPQIITDMYSPKGSYILEVYLVDK
jgi:hypothetical protein